VIEIEAAAVPEVMKRRDSRHDPRDLIVAGDARWFCQSGPNLRPALRPDPVGEQPSRGHPIVRRRTLALARHFRRRVQQRARLNARLSAPLQWNVLATSLMIGV